MGAIAAIGAVVGSVLGSVGIAVTATALTVGFETIAAVGAVVGAVGAVTKNKTLGFVGLALGAVGGIGALASSAGLLGSGAGVLGEAPTTAAAADAAAAGTIDSVAGAVDNTSTFVQAAGEGATTSVGEAAAGAGGFIDNTSSFVGGIGDAGGVGIGDVAGAVKPPGGLIQSAPSEGGPPSNETAVRNDVSAITDATNTAGGVAPASPIAETSAVPPPKDLIPGTPDAGTGRFTIGPGPGAMSSEGTDVFGNLVGFIDKHPGLAFGALQAGGSFLAGATNPLSPAQVKQLESQSAANDAATALVKQQTANLAAPKAVASSAPVTGTPQPLVPPKPLPQQVGFINQTPTPQITGAPA